MENFNKDNNIYLRWCLFYDALFSKSLYHTTKKHIFTSSYQASPGTCQQLNKQCKILIQDYSAQKRKQSSHSHKDYSVTFTLTAVW